MVITWILNSISKDIAEAFLYTTSARNHWLDLEARFGESNGPLLYKLQELVLEPNLQRRLISLSSSNF